MRASGPRSQGHHGRDARATRKQSDTRSRLQNDHAEEVRWGVRGAVRPLCNNPPNAVSGGAAMGFAQRTRRRPSAGRLRSSLIARKMPPLLCRIQQASLNL